MDPPTVDTVDTCSGCNLHSLKLGEPFTTSLEWSIMVRFCTDYKGVIRVLEHKEVYIYLIDDYLAEHLLLFWILLQLAS